jgi:hypothetical protein
MTERRRVRRRRIPFVRSAVLGVGERTHVVSLLDLGPEGAFLATRLEVPDEEADRLVLRLVIPRQGTEETVPCSLVWRNESFDASSGRPAGIAVRFGPLEPDVLRRIEEFAADGFLPGTDPSPWEHLEYRVLERFRVDERELNTMGLDGWELCSTRNIPAGVQMVFLRRL